MKQVERLKQIEPTKKPKFIIVCRYDNGATLYTRPDPENPHFMVRPDWSRMLMPMSFVSPWMEVLSNVVDGKRAHPTNSGCLLHLAVDEWDTLDDLGDELVAVESVPVFLRIGGQFEDHAKGGYA